MSEPSLKSLLKISKEDAIALFNFITGLPISRKVEFTALANGFVVQSANGFWIGYDELGIITRNFPDDRINYIKRNDFEIVDYVRSMGYNMKPSSGSNITQKFIIKNLAPNNKFKSRVLIKAKDNEEPPLVKAENKPNATANIRNGSAGQRQWMTMYNLLKNFCEWQDIRSLYTENKTLYGWLRIQRVKYSKGKLEAEKFKLLDDLKIGWEDINQAIFNNNFQELKMFFQQYSRLPSKRENMKLFKWFESQIILFNKGQLSPEREELIGRYYKPKSEK